MELKLAIVGAIISVSYLTSAVFLFLYTMGSTDKLSVDPEQMMNLYYISFDIFTMCNPYLLLFLSSTVRGEFVSFLTCNRFWKELNRVGTV
jgi:hypothetical protein